MTLSRQLKLEDSPDQKDASPLQISDTLLAVPFRGPEYTVFPSSEGLANLIIDVPRKARGVIGGLRQDCEERGRTQKPSLFFVQCILSVKLGLGFGTYVNTLSLALAPMPYVSCLIVQTCLSTYPSGFIIHPRYRNPIDIC